jgi:acetyl esterase
MKPSMLIKTSLSLFIALTFLPSVYSQTCNTGQVDDRASSFLKSVNANQAKVSVELIRKETPTSFKKLPEDSVKRIKATSSNIKINVVKASKKNNLPVIINFHPGGYVVPLMPWMEYDAMIIAKKFDAIVFDVDYRVAPENKFPAALDDAYNSYLWAIQHAKEYGGNPDKIILSGKDAGATLASLVVHRAKRNNTQKAIKGLIMICPFTDNPMISYYDSFENNATGYGLTKEKAQLYFQSYLEKIQWYSPNPEIWPIYEKDFSEMPSTLVVTTEFDVLRDEGIAYGKKLEQAGNSVAIKCYPHQIHNFSGLPENSEEVKRVYELMGEIITQQ